MVACFAVAPGLCAAQDAGIAGWVTDETGGALPGVTVEVSGAVPPGGLQAAVTDGDGRYAFSSLPPGSYAVRSTLPGFEPAERDVLLTAGFVATVDVSLRLGGLFEAARTKGGPAASATRPTTTSLRRNSIPAPSPS